MVAETPAPIKCTTFSILYARYRGDFTEAVRGVTALSALKPGDKVLIAEACSHHPLADDIGRIKLPRWLKEFVGGDLKIEVTAGSDYTENLKEFKLVIHCGGCMINKRQMLSRVQKAREQGVPITNYGLAIAYLHKVIERVLEPFPASLEAYRREAAKNPHEKTATVIL
jgi:predicted GTPase